MSLNPLTAIGQLFYLPFKATIKAYLRKATEDAFTEYKAECLAGLPTEVDMQRLALPQVEESEDDSKGKRKK